MPLETQNGFSACRQRVKKKKAEQAFNLQVADQNLHISCFNLQEESPLYSCLGLFFAYGDECYQRHHTPRVRTHIHTHERERERGTALFWLADSSFVASFFGTPKAQSRSSSSPQPSLCTAVAFGAKGEEVVVVELVAAEAEVVE
jgi:hypothetical protein